MAQRYDHLREKAIVLRTQHGMTLDDIVERLALPKTTVYYWIKDIAIPRTEKQTAAQRQRSEQVRVKYAALREAAYQQGLVEIPDLLKDVTFRDFVVLYMAEGYKRNRNSISFVNSDARMMQLAHRWILRLTSNQKGIEYAIQCHIDHDEDELKMYWGSMLGIEANKIKLMRKSNSGQLAGRQFRSPYGLLTVRVGDTYLRARLQAWMDFVKAQW